MMIGQLSLQKYTDALTLGRVKSTQEMQKSQRQQQRAEQLRQIVLPLVASGIFIALSLWIMSLIPTV